METFTALRLPNEMLKKVDDISRALERSRSYTIRKAIETFLDEYAELEKFNKISFSEKVNFVGEKIRKGFEKAGYTEKDIPRLITEMRAEKHKR